MLIGFSVQNFMSFKDITDFSMLATKVKRHKDHIVMCNDKAFLKGGFIFGANASGKSNLIKAIAFAKNIALNGINFYDFYKKYFRGDESFKDKACFFQFDFYINKHFYSYGFAISYKTLSIETEFLYGLYDEDKEQCIFNRNKTADGSFTIYSSLEFADTNKDIFNFYKKFYENEEQKHKLFLNDIARFNLHASFNDVINFFEHLLIFDNNCIQHNIIPLNKKNNFEDLIACFNLGIDALAKKKVDLDEIYKLSLRKDYPNFLYDLNNKLKEDGAFCFIDCGNEIIEIKNKKGNFSASKLLFKQNDIVFAFHELSSGSKKIIRLALLMQVLMQDYVIIIDDFDRELHVKVGIEFIKLFYYLTRGRLSQFIVSSHNVQNLNLDLVREDEIYFVEKERDYSSKIFSLATFALKSKDEINKSYLLGRYGAIPNIISYVLDE